MARPDGVLVDLAAGRPPGRVRDWGDLMHSAVEHRMTGLLWSAVSTGLLDCPFPYEVELATTDVIVRGHHRRIWNAASSVSRTLGELGVEFAITKGVPAQSRWYDRLGERPCQDLDLLVAPSAVDRLTEVVSALQPQFQLGEWFDEQFDRGLGQSVDLEVDGIAVDLHVDLFKLGPPSLDPERLWMHTVPFAGPDDLEVLVLDAELSLIHFLVNLSRDSFCWLIRFSDVARILTREEIDWALVARLAAEAGLDAPVWGGLEAVSDTLGLPEPPRRPDGWRGRLWRVGWRPSVRLQGDMGWIRHHRRAYLLPFVADLGLGPTLRWAWGQVVLSPALVARANPRRRGPWWWRLLRGRAGRLAARRRAARVAAEENHPSANDVRSPPSGADRRPAGALDQV